MADERKSNMKRGADDELAVGSERIRRSRKAAKLDEAIEFSAAEEPRPNDEPEPPWIPWKRARMRGAANPPMTTMKR